MVRALELVLRDVFFDVGSVEWRGRSDIDFLIEEPGLDLKLTIRVSDGAEDQAATKN
jgi:hypothetical protein